MRGMEAPHEDGPEEEIEQEAAPVMPPKKASGKKGMKMESENPARFMSKISLLTGALQDGADRKEIDKLIGEAPKEYKRLKDRKSDVAQKYREDLKSFHAEVDNYIDAQEEKTSTCRKLEKLKRELKAPQDQDEEAPATDESRVERVVKSPFRLFERTMDKILPFGKKLEKNEKKKAA